MDLSVFFLYFGVCLSMVDVSNSVPLYQEQPREKRPKDMFLSKQMSNTFMKHRQKRSDCHGNTYVNAECLCCHSKCTVQSLREGVYENCPWGYYYGHGYFVCNMYLTRQEEAYWTTYKSEETFLNALCNVEYCGDSQRGFTCKCSRGYEVLECDLGFFLPAALIPFVGILFTIMSICITYRRYKRRQLEKKTDVIRIKCDILTVVDDKDEFKMYTDDLMKVSRKTRQGINIKRMSICHLYTDNYRIKCDRVMFILHKEFNSLDSCVGVILSKIHFRKQRRSTALFIHVDDVSKNISLENKITGYNDVISNFNIKNKCSYVIHEMKYLDEWLPYVLREVFRIRSTGSRRANGSTYFIMRSSANADSDTIITLSETLERTLDIIGATKSTSPDSATCIITVARNISDIDIKEHLHKEKPIYVFLTMYSLNEGSVKRVYNREHIIKGIINVLVCLKMM